MKDREIEEKLQGALQENTPSVWDKIALRTGITAEQSEDMTVANGDGTASLAKAKGKGWLAPFLAIALALLLLLTAIIVRYFPKQGKLGGSFFIDINPSIQITLDDEGKVDEVIPLNEDACVLLSKTDGVLKGKSAEEAVVFVWQLAYDTGYISPDKRDNALLISSALTDESKNESFCFEVKENLKRFIKEKGVYCTVLTEKKVDAENSAASSYHITSGKYQLILRALALGVEIDEDDYDDISIRELNRLITEWAKGNNAFDDEELERRYEEKKEQAQSRLDSFIREEDFEEKFEDWLEEIEEEYERNWENKKWEWKENFDRDDDDDDDDDDDRGGWHREAP